MPHVLDIFLRNENHVPELEAKNANGFTALHIAANAGYVEIVKMFMEVKDTYGLEGK